MKGLFGSCVRLRLRAPLGAPTMLRKFPGVSMGMPCTQCAHSAKFWMLANTRTVVSAPFHKFLVPYRVRMWHI